MCPKHKTYNPKKQGQGGIKGGCICCGSIWSAYEAQYKLETAIRNAVWTAEAAAVPA
jgi:hypothetical protein